MQCSAIAFVAKCVLQVSVTLKNLHPPLPFPSLPPGTSKVLLLVETIGLTSLGAPGLKIVLRTSGSVGPKRVDKIVVGGYVLKPIKSGR